MEETNAQHARVSDAQAGLRFDQALVDLFPSFSRSRLQTWIRAGQVRVDGRIATAKEKVLGGEWIELESIAETDERCLPQALPIEIVHADEHLLVINKPPGLVVHPAAGHHDGTLRNALLHHAPELAAIPRSGIVHRLDKDTSGLLVVARTLEAHKYLVDALQAREIHREYVAIVHGRMTAGGTVDLPIGRHPTDRKRFAVRETGKPAVTHYRVEERLAHHTVARVQLETGRTHQIRVHLSHIRYPLVGDPVYGGRPRLPPKAAPQVLAALQGFKRQALHAAQLGFSHPTRGDWVEFSAPIPEDMLDLKAILAGCPTDRQRDGILD